MRRRQCFGSEAGCLRCKDEQRLASGREKLKKKSLVGCLNNVWSCDGRCFRWVFPMGVLFFLTREAAQCSFSFLTFFTPSQILHLFLPHSGLCNNIEGFKQIFVVLIQQPGICSSYQMNLVVTAELLLAVPFVRLKVSLPLTMADGLWRHLLYF